MSNALRRRTQEPVGQARRRRSALIGLCLAGLCAIQAGCHAPQPQTGRVTAASGGDITELHMITSPAAVNFGGTTGPAGFAARVYASSPQSPKTVPMARGTLEIQMYDGVVTAATGASARPLKVWTFSGEALRSRAKVSSVGTSYLLTLLWAESKPTHDRITIVACLNTEPQTKIYSAAAIIFVSAR
jgi:hypothetical protein